MQKAVNKAKDEVEEIDFDTLWGPSKPGDVSDNIFTEETKDPDKKYAEVFNVDVAGDAPEVIKKGLSVNVADAIHDLQEAAATLAEIGDGLDNVGKAVSCKACGGKVSLGQRNLYRKTMMRRGWKPEGHKAFWSKISSGMDKGGPGGHRACVARMEGKTDDPHSYCAWAENEATGNWPSEDQTQVQAVRKAHALGSRLAKQARALNSYLKGL
jgi:hypothetical protein